MQTFRLTKFTQWSSTEWGLPRVYYGGGKSQQSTSQVSIPPEVLSQYQNVNSIANQVAQTPFQQYSTDPNAFVAPLTPTQQAGINATNQYAGEAQPFYQTASNLNTPGAIQSYENPYESSVIQPTVNQMENQFGQAQQGALGNAIQSGAFGGDRAGVAAANLQNQQALALGQTVGGLENQNYSQALGATQNAATIEGNLGSGAQAAGLAGAQAQLTAGQAQQQTEQAGETALYNQFLQQQSYPFQTTQFLGNIAEGTGALSGSTTTSNQPAPYFSDERLKEGMEPVGKTFDGLTLYKYHYKGDKQTHVGLSAQDVERKHPDAVGLAGGYKTVDYDAATKASAEKGRAHQGGLVSGPSLSRRKFDIGGSAGLSPNAAWSAGFNLDPSYLQAQEAAYGNAPWGNAGPVSGAAPYGGKSHVPPSTGSPHAALAVAHPPQDHQQNGLQQLASSVNQIEGLGKTGKSLYNDAKGYVPGLSPSPAAPSAPAAPSSPAPAVQMPPERSAPVSASGSPIAPSSDASAGPVAGLDPNALDTTDDLGEMFSKRGGRIQRADGGGAAMTPQQFASSKISSGAFPSMTAEPVMGQHYLHDDTGRMLKGPGYPSRDAAEAARSKILDRAHKAYWKTQSAANGGLIHRDAGGATYTDAAQDDSSEGGDIPYDSGTGESGLSIPDDKPHNSLATSQPPASSANSGFNPTSLLGPIIGGLGLFGLASGGRVGLAGGGDPGDLPPLDDASAATQQGSPGLDVPAIQARLKAKAGAPGIDATLPQFDANEQPGVVAPRSMRPAKAPSTPTAGLNPNVPSPDAQPVQAQQQVQDMGSGQHVTQPGEVLTQDNPGGIGDFLNRNQGLLVPALHGLGTMASSNSRYLGSAILQGLGGAADSYENTQNEMQGRVLNQPILQQRQNEASNAALTGLAQYNQMNGTNLSIQDYLTYLKTGNPPAKQGQNGGPGMTGNGPQSMGTPQHPTYSQCEKDLMVINGIPAYNNPGYMSGFNNKWAGVAATSPYFNGQVAQGNHTVGAANANGFVTDANNSRVPVPGYESTALAQNHPAVLASQAADFQNQGVNFMKEYGRSMSLFDELGDVYHQFQAGPTADWRASVSRLANEFDPSGQYPFIHNIPAGNDAANYDKARKDIAQLTASQLNGMPGGAPKAETDLLGHFAADPHLSPDALRDIVVRGKANIQQQADYYRGFDPFGNGAQGVPAYSMDFYKNQPFEKYRQQFDKTVPSFAGQQGGQGQPAPVVAQAK